MSTIPRATTTAEAFHALDPFAVVKPGDPFFADIEADLPVKHYGVSARLKRHFRGIGPGMPWQHIALVGHRGTGETTLVRNAMSSLPGVIGIHIDASFAFDQADVRFADMVLVIARAVIHCLDQQSVELDPELVAQVQRWFAEELLEESQTRQILGAIETSAGADNKLALLAQFSAKVTAALKSNTDYRKTIRTRAERDPQDLLRRLNSLLDGAHEAIAARSQQLCVVFDNLEKVPQRALIDAAVLRRADEFRVLRCHLLIFLNPADQYSPITVQASQAFPLITVPVLPVRFRGDPPDVVRPEARRAITRLLDARVMRFASDAS